MSFHHISSSRRPVIEKAVPNTIGAIYHHRDCIGHVISGHPESPTRVIAIMKELRKQWPTEMFREAPLVDESHILLFHTAEYLVELKNICDRAEKTRKKISIDGDTAVMVASRAALYRAAGSIIAAVDDIYDGTSFGTNKLRSAFCCTRPPGHHAERDSAMGFCYLNNTGIAAKYAQKKYGLDRVAILDFDVHHGNGSAHGFADDPSIFYGSTHEKDNYPGTGKEPMLSPVSLEEITAMRDELGNELFAAICGDLSGPAPFDMPATAGMKITVADVEEKRRIVDRTIVASGSLSRRSFRQKWREVVYEMVRFKPLLVIISAGFDAHKRDPLASLDLVEDDFEWATKLVMDACRCCGESMKRMTVSKSTNSTGSVEDSKIDKFASEEELGMSMETDSTTLSTSVDGVCPRKKFPVAIPCISILEGGYNIEAISSSCARHVRVLFNEAEAHYQDELVHDNNSLYVEGEDGTENYSTGVDDLSLSLSGVSIEPLEQDSSSSVVDEKVNCIGGESFNCCSDGSGGVGEEDAVQGVSESVETTKPKSIEEILASLDISINSLMIDALLHVQSTGVMESSGECDKDNELDEEEGGEDGGGKLSPIQDDRI